MFHICFGGADSCILTKYIIQQGGQKIKMFFRKKSKNAVKKEKEEYPVSAFFEKTRSCCKIESQQQLPVVMQFKMAACKAR